MERMWARMGALSSRIDDLEEMAMYKNKGKARQPVDLESESKGMEVNETPMLKNKRRASQIIDLTRKISSIIDSRT